MVDVAGKVDDKVMQTVLDALPVEISFVDADDTVRYFNKDGNRIFPRTDAVLGRKVQQCHPPKSLDKVEAILKGFKEGKFGKADFWINLKGMTVLIRYFPVRDKGGKYLGCLEVAQDITEIRKIEGEKRLL
ncbi:MAG: PAS domain-containing protein [Candidatus Altiarchaeota archaeon]